MRRRILRRTLGTDLPDGEVKRILEGLELEIRSVDDEAWTVVAPPFRRDLSAEEDLVEEVARIHGYDRLPERTLLHAAALSHDSPGVRAQDRTRSLWLGFGLTEVVTPALVDAARETGLGTDDFFRAPVPLRNPLSNDRDALRGSLIPSLLQVLATNVARAGSDLALFEVGRVWSGDPARRIDERLRLGVLLSGRGLEAERTMGGKSCDFFDMKGLLEVYVEEFRGALLRPESASPALLDPIRSARILVNGDTIGFLGEVGPGTRKAFDLPADLPVVVAELDLDGDRTHEEDREFQALPRYPGVLRDLAFVVPRRVRHAELADSIVASAGDLLTEVRLFDVYEGTPLAEQEKSLAFTLLFRSPERSLTHEEVDERVAAVVEHLGKAVGARIR
jgi:phenylalanyl-tRNA synthetase beta chain